MKRIVIAAACIFGGLAALAETATIGDYTWSYTVSDGKATITGVSPNTGDIEIPSAVGDASYPVTGIGDYAFNGCSELTGVTIPEGVTGIGEVAFLGCTSLESVTIPSSVTSIGSHAFARCNALTAFEVDEDNSEYSSANGLLLSKDGKTLIQGVNGEVTIPNSVTSIGDRAFYGCSALKSVTMCYGVQSIGVQAFCDCTSLTNVTIPASVESIGDGAFEGCSALISIEVDEDNSEYSSAKGLLLSKDGKTLIQGVNGEVTIPDSVESIGTYAFWKCTSLTSVIIPEGVKSIGDYAFYYCTSLTSVTIPSSVTSIGNYAFARCSELTSVTIPQGVTSIGNYAFSGCSGLTCVTIPDSVTSIGNYAFRDCSALEKAYIPSALKGEFAEGDVFSNCGSALAIRYYNWKYTSSGSAATITGVELSDSDGNSTTDKIAGHLAIPAQIDKLTVTSIGNEAFNGCTSLTGVTIPDSVESIGAGAFYNCTSLKSVTIPQGVTRIEVSAFYNCTSLTSVIIPEGVKSIGDWAFRDCSGLTSVTIPEGVTSIGNSAFSFCSGLTNVTIPASVESIGENAFSGCSALASIEVDEDNSEYSSVKGLLLSKDGKTLIQGVNGEVTIPDSVESIGDYAFWGCSGLESVTIPDSIESIGTYAFWKCTSLTGVTIPDSVTSVGDWAFGGCTSLKSVTIPDSVTSIGVEAFSGCSGLEKAYIPLTLKALVAANNVFSNCGSTLAIRYYEWEYTTSDSAATIAGVELYDGTGSLIDGESIAGHLAIPAQIDSYTVTSIGEGAFSDCTSLTGVTIPASVTSIGKDAFSGCSALTGVYISDLAKWCAISFANSAANPLRFAQKLYLDGSLVEDLTIPQGVTSIGDYAFSGCSGLTSVTIPYGVTSIGNYAFSGCSTLEKAYIPLALKDKVVANNVFSNCGSTLAIRYYNWKYTSSGSAATITVVELSDSDGNSTTDKIAGHLAIPAQIDSYTVTSIGDKAFNGCSALKSVTIPEGVTSIGGKAFYNCTSLTGVTIPASVTSIGSDAFYGCSALTGVYISDLAKWCAISFPNSVANPLRFAQKLYLDGSLVEDLTIPQGVTSIGGYAFYNCASLKRVTILEGVKSIGSYAFFGCTSLKSVTIPASATSIVTTAFSGCSALTAFEVDEENSMYSSANGLLLSKDGQTLIQGVNGEVTIPEGVTNIWESAFSGCTSLKSVTIPASVESIGIYAFNGCSALTGVTIAEGVESIGVKVFYNCTSLESVTIPASVESIGESAFYNCSALKSVTIAEGVESIGISAFYNCSALKSVTIPDSVTSIGAGAFAGCTSLTSVTIPYGVTSIGNNTFNNCTSLESVTIPASVKSIGDNTFYTCTSLTSVTIPYGVTSIGQYAFYCCTSLTSVTIPYGVTSIGDSAFYGCTALTSVTIPSSVTDIGNRAFCVCTGLETAHVPESLKAQITDNNVFAGCSGTLKIEYYTSTFPEVADDADAATVDEAVDEIGFADSAVITLIGGSAAKYNAFKAWAQVVAGGEGAVKASSHAAVSYLFGAAALFANEPKVEIGKFALGASGGALEIDVVVKDGENPVAVAAANVAAMFEATSDLGDWDGAALTPSVTVKGTDSSGTMSFTVTPGDGTAARAFLRIRP